MSTTVNNLEKRGESSGQVRGLLAGLRDYLGSIRMFSSNARLFLIGSFLIGLDFKVFQFLFNLYLKELGFAESAIGFLNSSRALGMTLIAIPAAILLTKVRLKVLLYSSCILFAVFTYGLASFHEMSLLIGCAFLAGTSFSFFRVASSPFYMRNSSPAERTHLFSFSFAAQLLSGMIGSWGAGLMVTYIGDITGDIVLGYRFTLYAAIAVSLIALVPFARIRTGSPSDGGDRIAITLNQLKRRGGFYARVGSVNFLIGIGAGLVIPFLNLYFRDRFYLGPDRIGFYFILLSFGMLVGTLCGPLLTRRLGLVRTIVITQLASIPFMLVLSYTYSLALAVPAFVIRGGLMNLGMPISTNFGMEMSEEQEQGFVNALLMVSWTSAWMVAVAVGGHLIEVYGYTIVLNISAALYVASSFIYYGFFGRSERKNRDSIGWRMAREGDL